MFVEKADSVNYWVGWVHCINVKTSFFIHAMNVYGWSESTAPLNLHLNSRRTWDVLDEGKGHPRHRREWEISNLFTNSALDGPNTMIQPLYSRERQRVAILSATYTGYCFEISLSSRNTALYTQKWQETSMPPSSGIRTRVPSKRAAADPRFRPRGYCQLFAE